MLQRNGRNSPQRVVQVKVTPDYMPRLVAALQQ
jgi:hypothetical protein